MKPITYVPVAVDAAENVLDEVRDRLGNTLNWVWPESDYFNYDWLLTSPMQVWRRSVNQPMPSARRELRIPSATRIVVDSGGFMELQNKFHGTAEEVTELFEASAVRGDLCFILDRPPFHRKPGSMLHFDVEPATDEEAEDAMRWSCRNARIQLQRRKGEYDLSMVVHGRTPREMLRWHRAMQQIGDFDGITFAPKHDWKAQLMAMVISHQYAPTRPIHWLGLAGARPFALAAYLSTFTDSRITMDSSTAIYYAAIQYYLLPGQIYATPFRRGEAAMMDAPDDCPVCVWNDREQFRGDATGRLSVRLLTLHNLYQILRYIKTMNSVKNSREHLLEFAPRETVVLLDGFDYYIKHGLEKFLERLPRIEAALKAEFQGSQRTMDHYAEGRTVLCDVCLKRPSSIERPLTPRDRATIPLCEVCDTLLSRRDEIMTAARQVVAPA